jgi:cobalt-zinc-cadmium efflux system outer membrane protein
MSNRLSIRSGQTGPLTRLGLGCIALAMAATAWPDPLTLAEAESIAVVTDPSIQAFEARASAMEELAVAAEQLPDPRLRMGAMGLPVDTFDIDQEPMTQLQIGIQQQFPAGKTRQYRGEQMRKRAGRFTADSEARTLAAVRDVREAYVGVMLKQRQQTILEESREIFRDLADIIGDYYATGRAQQQDVLRAALELSRVEERLNKITQQEEQTRARLEELIGPPAYRDLAPDWPALAEPRAAEGIIAGLAMHPRVVTLSREIEAAQSGEKIAQQQYKPSFAVDLVYGGRSAHRPDGSTLPDLVSVMLSMSVPLFTARRQDRVVAARVAETSAATFMRDDLLRQMRSQVELNAAALERQRERLELYTATLLPQAEFNAAASFEAYQQTVGDLTKLMRARITEYELRLDQANLIADELVSRARLLYLEGEGS